MFPSYANCKRAMELAREHFGIPLVLSPENLSSPDLDELSGMTYLSYFMKLKSPGYKATLDWVRAQLPDQKVKDFQVGSHQAHSSFFDKCSGLHLSKR